ncbi:hypothetical protein C8R47DRAFT_1080977 [Mycena vitilis]|nr:hypothetical protein C8R47DRAFT_1080977 [Mycena vitilis]
MGRNAEQGRAALEVMRGPAPKGSEIEVEYIQGDLSTDYLVMCQNGTPAAHKMKDNADGHDAAFAIQALSRVALPYFLTTSGGPSANSCSGIQYRYYSLIPGLVKIERFDPGFAPGFIKYAMLDRDQAYRDHAGRILASPDVPLTLGTAKSLNRSLTPMALGKWSRDPRNREKMWGKMMQIRRGDS